MAWVECPRTRCECGRLIAVRRLDGRTYTHADYRVPPRRQGGRWRQPWCPGSMRPTDYKALPALKR